MGAALININDKRVINADKAIWKAIVYLLEMDKDGFPFTASDVARKIGKEKSSAMITRNRGGLAQMVVRSDTVLAIRTPVSTSPGVILLDTKNKK